MTGYRFLITGCSAMAILCAAALTGHAAPPQAAPTAAESATVKASPDLTAALTKEIGATPEQSAGAAGALFGAAKSQMKPTDWTQVANAVPGMAALLKAAPATGGKKVIRCRISPGPRAASRPPQPHSRNWVSVPTSSPRPFPC